MLDHLQALTDGWPKVVSGALCYCAGDGVRPLATPAQLLAWLDRHALVRWRRGGVSKEEFFEGVRQRADAFAWATPHPHHPPLPEVLYTRPAPAPANTGRLAQFIARFSPATPQDRELLTAAALTLFWGGPPGKRPAFVLTGGTGLDPKRGCGVGKTTLVELLAGLAGGALTVRPGTSPDRTLAGLLSPSALPLRVALIDNLKSYRFSSDLIESLITAETINGHRLHHGHAARPNLLTWWITVNGAAFSKDMAQRSVVIRLKRPTPSAAWYATTVAFARDHQDAIVADILWRLQTPGLALTKCDRWPDWANGVLNRVAEPAALLELIEQRRAGLDEDDENAADVLDHVRACLQAVYAEHGDGTADVDQLRVAIPRPLLTVWVAKLKRGYSDSQVAGYLKQVQSPLLTDYRTKSRRFYLWTGPLATAATKVKELPYRPDPTPR
jgi:hypothetical protein